MFALVRFSGELGAGKENKQKDGGGRLATVFRLGVCTIKRDGLCVYGLSAVFSLDWGFSWKRD